MKHLSGRLPDSDIELLRKYSAKAEALGELTIGQMELIYQRQWFRLFVPQEYGGLNLSLPEAVRLEENIAYADGSVGWVVTLCAGAAMFIGYFDEQLRKEVFADPQACLAGSGQTNGVAKVIEGGYEVSGSWPHSSGAPHATWFTANCFIEKNGKRLIRDNGQPLIQSFIFKRDEVNLNRNWNYMGLNATAGHAYSVEKLEVPPNRTFIIDAAHTQLPQPIYRYPFLQLAETTIAANISGMCLYFLNLAKELISQKTNSSSMPGSAGNQLIIDAERELQLIREDFYISLDHSWNVQVKYSQIDPGILHSVSEASLRLAHQTRKWVDLVYPYCGLEAARTDTAINRVWRNIHTASQHSLMRAVSLEQ